MCSIAIGMPLRCNRRTSQTSFNPKGRIIGRFYTHSGALASGLR
jgi:hypothetical protein